MFKILVIEDGSVLRRLLKTTLQAQGFEVIEAEDGETGLLQAQSVRPTLIISGLHLPGINGVEVCRRIKSNPTLVSTFFILLTGDHSPQNQYLAQEAGADAFLSKPLKVEELGTRLRAWIRLRGVKGWMQSQQVFQEERQLTQQLRFQQQILETELQEAASYVRSLLPQPCQSPIAIDYQFLPSKYLGGDCFDYFWLDADQLVIYLLDVSGHGLGSALFSVSIQSVLRSQSLLHVQFDQPDQVLRALNERFQTKTDNNIRYFTIWYGVYRCSSRQLIYASAGHPAALLMAEDATVAHLKTRGKPIGLFLDCQFVNATYTLNQPSFLYLFSDGIYEFTQLDGTTWRRDEFINLLIQDKTHTSPMTTAEVIGSVKKRLRGNEFEDDCSILRAKLV